MLVHIEDSAFPPFSFVFYCNEKRKARDHRAHGQAFHCRSHKSALRASSRAAAAFGGTSAHTQDQAVAVATTAESPEVSPREPEWAAGYV